MKIRKWAALLLLLALLPTVGCGEAAQVGEIAQPDNPVLRVRLARLNIADRVDLSLNGLYGLDTGDGPAMTFPRNSELTILLREGGLVVYYRGMRWEAGESLKLIRFEAAGDENGLRFQTDGNLYEGDLWLTAGDEGIRAVLHIRLEDYLLGVVGYEMSDSFPLDALKAQSVAARTYALKRVGRYDDYDVVDTTNDQVFKGRDLSQTNAARAIAETRGVCGYDGDALANCYFGATNGGQTELAENRWGADSAAFYLQMFDDPYDLANPRSNVRSVTLPKKAKAGEVVSLGLRQVLCAALSEELLARGWDASPESLRVDTVTAVSVDTPMYAEPSRLYTKLHITLTYSGRTRTDPAVAVNMPDEQEVELFASAPTTTVAPTPAPTAAPTAESDATDAPTPSPSPTPAPIYGEFTAVEEPVSLDIDLFPEGETQLGLSHNSYANELITVRETDEAFILESRRYGHGVGLSQRGAEWMALMHQKTWLEILQFYYPGLEFKRFTGEELPASTLRPIQLETPGPRPTATPRPTLMPVTQDVPEGGWIAVVTGIDDDSTLNLRSAPDMDGEIVRRLYKNQRLVVLERCPEEGWVHVRTDAAEGYVMESFLSEEE